MEPRSDARLRPLKERKRPLRPGAAAIMATAAAARTNLPAAPPAQAPPALAPPAPAPPAPAQAPGGLTPAPAAPVRTPSPVGPPRKNVAFPPVAAASRASPGGTTRYWQASGMRFPKLSLFEHEQYVRYTGDEDGQRGSVDATYSVLPTVKPLRNRPSFRPQLTDLPPRSFTPTRFSGGFILGPSVQYQRRPSVILTPWQRLWRNLKRNFTSILVYILLASLFFDDPGKLRDRFRSILWPPGDSDGNASRILVDPLGTDHVSHIANSSLSIDQFCNHMDGTGITSGIAKKVSHTVQNFATWIQRMQESEEPELSRIARKYDEALTEGYVIKSLAHDMETRTCQLAGVLMEEGLGFEDTREFASKLRSYKAEAKELRPSQTAVEKSNMWIAAKSTDWDYDLVEEAFRTLQEYLFRRQKLAQDMTTEADALIKPSVDFVTRYTKFVHVPTYADDDRRKACSAIQERSWFGGFAWDCDAKSYSGLLYHELHSGNHHRPRWWGLAMQRYLEDSRDIWNNYANHIGDGLALLANLPKLKKDLTAEGIPARMEHLYSLFENLAKQADLTAERLQDAYERKYVVELDLTKTPKPSSWTGGPPEIGYCKGCDERAASSWSSSISSTNVYWSSVYKNLPPGKTDPPLIRVTQPGVRRDSTTHHASTFTDIVKVVNVLG